MFIKTSRCQNPKNELVDLSLPEKISFRSTCRRNASLSASLIDLSTNHRKEFYADVDQRIQPFGTQTCDWLSPGFQFAFMNTAQTRTCCFPPPSQSIKLSFSPGETEDL